MRTTVELPDELFRQVKARAALEGRKLKDLITEFVEQGLERGQGCGVEKPRRQTPLPFIPQASVGGVIPALTSEELSRIEEEEDLARLDRSFGR